MSGKFAMFAEGVAAEAADLAMQGFRKRPNATKKGTIDLLTEYDLAAEKLIRERICARYPEHRVIGEEHGVTGEGERVWYVDPIDGTTNFAHGHPFFCTSLAYYEDGVPKAAAVVAPALGVTWTAAAGEPALRNGSPCRVSTTESLGERFAQQGFRTIGGRIPTTTRRSSPRSSRKHRASVVVGARPSISVSSPTEPTMSTGSRVFHHGICAAGPLWFSRRVAGSPTTRVTPQTHGPAVLWPRMGEFIRSFWPS